MNFSDPSLDLGEDPLVDDRFAERLQCNRLQDALIQKTLLPPVTVESFNGDRYDLGNYEGMIKHNINTVVESLK